MNKEESSIFEDFLEYCNEDNPQLKKDIECWLADFFDLPNREKKLHIEEIKWIRHNLTNENQLRILGYNANTFNKREGLK